MGRREPRRRHPERSVNTSNAVGFGVSDVQEPGRNDGVLDMLSVFRAYRLVVDADAAAGDAVDE